MAQTYKFGNGTWATKKGSTLAYSDTNNAFKPLPFSFERNSIATRVNKEGLIEVVGNDIPRIDYTDSSEGALLLENSATNLITYSEDFSNSSWLKANSTITNGFISPDGTNTAKKLIEGTNNISHFVYSNIFLSGLRTFSVYLKKAERNFAFITDGQNGNGMNVNLTNGTFSSINNPTNPKIQNVGNDWYRCSFGSNVSSVWQARIDTAISSGRDYQGDGTSGIYIWGAMLEANSVASSYIPTNGSTVQRAAETCNGSGNSEVFNDSQGVLFANIAANQETNSTNARINIHNGSATEMVRLGYTTSQNQIIAVIVANGGVQAAPSTIVSNITLYNKCAIKYKANDFALWVNGFEVGTDLSGTTPSGLNELSFEKHDGVEDFYGKTKELGYYNTALTDEELEYMTSYRSLNEMVTELNLNAL